MTKPSLTGANHRPASDVPFFLIFGAIGSSYVVLIIAMLAADVVYMVDSGGPSAADALKVVPTQKDVDFDQPTGDEIKKCTIKMEKTGDASGWVVRDGEGRVIRRFLDTDGDNKLDQWQYFKNEVLVHEDIGTDFNRAADHWRQQNPILAALANDNIQYSIKLSLISCTFSAIFSVVVAIPIGYFMSRYRFPGREIVDAVLDIPIVLPPLVVGLSLLILFRYAPEPLRRAVVFEIPAVILAQFAVAAAFSVRTMRATFDQIDERREQVALTLGCSRAQAFGYIALPEAWRGIVAAGTLAWARSLGEFGPLLVFAGATRMKTEVLSTTVFLELSVGNLEAAVAVSLIMVALAIIVLVLTRFLGTRNLAV